MRVGESWISRIISAAPSLPLSLCNQLCTYEGQNHIYLHPATEKVSITQINKGRFKEIIIKFKSTYMRFLESYFEFKGTKYIMLMLTIFYRFKVRVKIINRINLGK